jgi:ketosteroid isomerase-like protein
MRPNPPRNTHPVPGDHAEAIRRSNEAFNAFMRGELSNEAYAEIYDPEVEVVWQDRQTYPDFPQRLRGVSQLLAFSEEYRERWSDLSAEPLELTEAKGNQVVGLIRQCGQGRQSGVPIRIHFFALYTLRDGKLCKVEYFRHRADALKAAGMS